MSFKIIVDSCCDLTAAQLHDGPFDMVPLTLSLAGEELIDNDNFDQTRMLKLMRDNTQPPQTACPSPAQYMDAFEAANADDIYVITLSALLSGSHNSAAQARALWLEDHPGAHIHIFNSCSAAAGEVVEAIKLKELAESGLDFETVVNEETRFISSQTTYFVLEDLDHLRKNGRLTGALSVLTEALRIKLLMGGTREGQIKKVGQALSVKQALSKMVSLMAADPNHVGKTLSIVHVNNPDRAFYLNELVQKACHFKEVLISNARGVTTVYANNGGVVAAF